MLAALILITLLGLITYKIFIDPIREHEAAVLIGTIALAIAMQEVMLLLFTGDYLSVPSLIKGYFSLFGVKVFYQQLLTFGMVLVILFALRLLLMNTRLGLAIRSTAEDREVANLMGMNESRVAMIAMGISVALAAITGAVIVPLTILTPFMWMHPLIMMMAVVVLGGEQTPDADLMERYYRGSETTDPAADPDDPALPRMLPRTYALDEKIKVDLALPGCPPHPDHIAEAILALLAGRTPNLPSKSVCDTCPTRREGKGAVKQVRRFLQNAHYDPEKPLGEMRCLLEQGLLCCGIATRAGLTFAGGTTGVETVTIGGVAFSLGVNATAQDAANDLAEQINHDNRLGIWCNTVSDGLWGDAENVITDVRENRNRPVDQSSCG